MKNKKTNVSAPCIFECRWFPPFFAVLYLLAAIHQVIILFIYIVYILFNGVMQEESAIDRCHERLQCL